MDTWVPIYRGTLSQVLVLRCRLEAAGVPVFLKDEVMKVLDPVITGGSALAIDLLVPAEQEGEARSCLGASLEPKAEPLRQADRANARRWLLGTAAVFVTVLLLQLLV